MMNMLFVIFNTIAINMRLMSAWNVASVAEELDFLFHFILI